MVGDEEGVGKVRKLPWNLKVRRGLYMGSERG